MMDFLGMIYYEHILVFLYYFELFYWPVLRHMPQRAPSIMSHLAEIKHQYSIKPF